MLKIFAFISNKMLKTLIKAALHVKALLLVGLSVVLFSGCGFHFPNQAPLSSTIPEMYVIGDYHSQFYKLVVNGLETNGVTVIERDSGFTPRIDDDKPTLMLTDPKVVDEVVSVNSRAQSIENSILVSTAATLYIPNHRPIVMRNSITRSMLNKPGQSLSADTEKATLIVETKEQLAEDLIMRLSYLGRTSDPDTVGPQPNELVAADGEEAPPMAPTVNNDVQSLTLMEALQHQDAIDSANATQVTLDSLNNGQRVLSPKKTYKLPKVPVERLHTAPN